MTSSQNPDYLDAFFHSWKLQRAASSWLIVGASRPPESMLSMLLGCKNPWESPFLETISKKDSSKIVRSKISALAHFSNDGQNRVLFIEDIDEMSAYAHNSLLKALEESSPGVYFLATAMRVGPIPETVLSRFRVLHVQQGPSASEVSPHYERNRAFWTALFEQKPITQWVETFYTITTTAESMAQACAVLIEMLQERAHSSQDPTWAAAALEIERLSQKTQKLNISPKSLFFEIGNRLKLV